MQINRSDTAVVFIDPQNEVLSETGLAWPLVRESLEENNTIENMERTFKVAKTHGFEIFISPHYFYPTDKGWKFNGPLESRLTRSGGPETNDLVLQLRKRKIDKIILGGMLANMCVESHLRELLEQGFEVAVVKDATAAPKHPEWGYGYTAALINYAFLAHAVLRTDDVVSAIEQRKPGLAA
jgi:nicotinamidase-related amidase